MVGRCPRAVRVPTSCSWSPTRSASVVGCPPSVDLPWRRAPASPRASSSPATTPTRRPCSPSRASLFTGRYLPGHGVVDNVIMPEHNELDPAIPTIGSTPARRRLPVHLHRQVAPVAVRRARHGGLRLRRLGRQRPALHGLGGNRRALRSRSSPPTRLAGCAPTPPTLTVRGPGSSPSRWSTRTTSCGSRSTSPATRERHPEEVGRDPPRARGRGVEGRRPAARLPRRLRRGGRRAPRATSTTTCTPSPTPTGSGVGTSSTGSVGLHRPGRQAGLAPPPRLLRGAAPAGRPVASARSSARWKRQRRLGRHRRDLHLRPRRHVRLARPALEGPLRLRGDHARALVRPGARRHHARRRPPSALGHPRRPGRDDLLPGRRDPASVIDAAGHALAGTSTCRRCSADPAATVRDHVLFAQDSAHTDNLNRVRYAFAGSSTAGPSTPGTTASAAANRLPGCGARTRAASSSTSTATSTTRTTSGTTTTPTRSSWSTSPTTDLGASELRDLYGRLRAYETEELVLRPSTSQPSRLTAGTGWPCRSHSAARRLRRMRPLFMKPRATRVRDPARLQSAKARSTSKWTTASVPGRSRPTKLWFSWPVKVSLWPVHGQTGRAGVQWRGPGAEFECVTGVGALGAGAPVGTEESRCRRPRSRR